MSSFFTRLKAGLARTAQQIRERLGDADESADLPAAAQPSPAGTDAAGSGSAGRQGQAGFGAVKAKRTVAVETYDAVEDALLGADVGLAATERIIEAVRQDRQGTIRERVARVITKVLTDVPPAPAIAVRPHVVLVVGVNGTGKTTTIGKLARFHQAEGRSVLVCAADTFRAAAVEPMEALRRG